jgi:hypothetical protein
MDVDLGVKVPGTEEGCVSPARQTHKSRFTIPCSGPESEDIDRPDQINFAHRCQSKEDNALGLTVRHTIS